VRAGVHQIDSNGAYLQAWLWVWWLAAVSALLMSPVLPCARRL
jgi:hypothetical protein